MILDVLFGLLFALAARRQLREGRSPWGREGRMVGSFAAIVATPIALYLWWVHPDWTLHYAIDPGTLPSSAWLFAAALTVGALAVGYAGGAALIRRRGPRAAGLALGADLLVLLLALGIARHRIWLYGTYAGFRRGDVVALTDTHLFWVLLVALVGSVAAATFVMRALRAESRRKGAAAIASRRR